MKVFFKRIIYIIKPYLFMEITGFLLTLLSSIAVFASPLASKYLIDEILPANSIDKVYTGLILFCIVLLVQPLIGYFKDLLFSYISEKISLGIRNRLFEKMIFAPVKFFENSKTGEIISRIVNSGSTAGSFISQFFVSNIQSVLLVILILAGMFYTSFTITLIVVIFYALYTPVSMLFSNKARELSRQSQINSDKICTSVSQTVDSIMTIKSFLLEDIISKKYYDISHQTYKNNIKTNSLGILILNLSYISSVLSLCVIYGIGTVYVMKGKMTTGSVIAMAMYFQMLAQPVSSLIGSNLSIKKIAPVFDRIYEYFNMESEIIGKGNNVCKNGEIRLDNVNFSYYEGIIILKNVNLTIRDKEYVAVVGRSGSGKSTFAKLIMGYYKPDSGSIHIGGIESGKIGIDNIRKTIGYVPQKVDLFNTSIKENIQYGNMKASPDEIMDICKQVKLHDMIMSLPQKYDTVISEKTNLSGGEIQRIGICRALLKKPAILILDEPTSSLDMDNEKIIREIVDKVSGYCTVIIIAHKPSTIKNAHRVLFIDEGEIHDMHHNFSDIDDLKLQVGI